MKRHEKVLTKVVHSQSKPACNVVGAVLGGPYKIARVPYYFSEVNEALTIKEKHEALLRAEFISRCFNMSDYIYDSKFGIE